MKANELRLGNYIIFDGKITEVQKVDIGLILDGYHKEYYKPIPLTEEWLIKSGFKFYDGSELYGYLYYDKRITENLVLTISEKNGIYTWCFGDEDLITEDWLEIKHVHQLQNMWFALTGEELTIKEDETKK